MLKSTKKNVDSNRCAGGLGGGGGGRRGRSSSSSPVWQVRMANQENGSRGVGVVANGHHASKLTSTTLNGATTTSSNVRNRRVPLFRVQRVNKTTSVIVTLAFVLIFTFVIAMEILFMDENNRFKLHSKIPVMVEVADDNAAAAAAVETVAAARTVLLHDLPPPPPSNLHISDDGVTNRPLVDHDNDSKRQPVSVVEPKPVVVVRDVKAAAAAASRALRQETLMLREPPLPPLRSSSASPLPSDNAARAKGDWQPVLGTQNKFYVYSAYLDVRQGSFIRVLAATRTRGSDKVNCVYWYNNAAQPVIVSANNKAIRENWNLKYSAMFVLCPLFVYSLGRKVAVPDEVSIVVSRSSGGVVRDGGLQSVARIGNRLRVLNRNADTTKTATEDGTIVDDGFAVCVKPLHYRYNRAVQLIEFIELNRILGVRHFTFYNHTIGSEVDCVLRDYVRQGLVTLLPWQLDMASQKEIRTEGLFAAINDCLYRNMYKYRYLLMIDIDEFIVPHRNTTLDSIIDELHRKVVRSKAASFSFMNSFFYLQWPNDANARDLPQSLVTLQKTKRRAKFHPHKQRSKCIVVPRFVVEMGNHFVWEFLPGKGAVNVPPDVAFLHHYRVCEFGGNDCIKTQSVTDRTVYRYKTDLVQRVAQRLNKSRTEGPHECRQLNYETQLKR